MGNGSLPPEDPNLIRYLEEKERKKKEEEREERASEPEREMKGEVKSTGKTGQE